jgi:cytochrome c oxidase subunit IV
MSADSTAHGHDGHHDGPHVVPASMLIGVWAALTALTVLTVWSAQHDLGAVDLIIAMVIATVKALMVALIFMHLLWDRPFNGLIFMSSLIFAGLFVTFALLDVSQNQPSIAQRSFDAPPVGAQAPDYAAEFALHAADHAGEEHAAEGDHGDSHDAAAAGDHADEAHPEGGAEPGSDH